MAFDEPSDVTELTQELRLATTMTGGVSLAIWMAGVAREINLLCQASQWRRLGGPFPQNRFSESAASLKLYKQLIDLLDMVVDVDILAGTSAGGINAALLAWSRVKGCDLGTLRDLWLQLGDLTDLLRDPGEKSTPSLLYGDKRMFAALAEELQNLPPGPFPPEAFPKPKGPCPPPTTLYITTTLLTGEIGRFTDCFGTLIQDVDRRGVFTFTETLLASKDDAARALALAARSSASFPAAFEPSFVPFVDETAKKGGVPARPAMADFADITRPHWVVDGGLLDNRPIDVLLQRVFDRPAHRPVRRVLLFVVPSSGPAPDLVQDVLQDDFNKPLGLVEGLLQGLAALTTQSIAADLRAIRSHQDRMEARTESRLRLAEFAAKLHEATGERLLSTSLLADYGTREATKQAQALTTAMLRQLSTWPPDDGRSTKSIPQTWEKDLAIGGDGEKLCRLQIKASILNRWLQSSAEPLPEIGRLNPGDLQLPGTLAELAGYGPAALQWAKACALIVIQAAYQLAKSEADVAAVAKLAKKINQAGASCESPNLGALVEKLCTEPAVRQGPLDIAAGRLAQRYLEQFTVTEQDWDRLAGPLSDGCQTLSRLAAQASPACDAERNSQLAQDEAAANQLNTYLSYLQPGEDPLTVATKLFDLAVTQRAMLPAEVDIEQPLDFVQVSADTRSLLAPKFQTAQQKLTGIQFHHFGAFYKRSWRANDWLWGRLDGAGWLIQVLLDPRRVRWIVQVRANDRPDGTDGPHSGARWFLDKLKELGAPEFPASGYRLVPSKPNDENNAAAGDGPNAYLTEDLLLEELAFVDEPSKEIPPSIPYTSLWLALAWQHRVLDEDLDELANSVNDPEPGKKLDWSPPRSRSWAKKVKAASPRDAKYALLNDNPVAGETLSSDKGSPLMARTIAHAAATASAAAGSVQQMPSVLKPPLATLRTVTLGGYRVVSLAKGVWRQFIIVGAALVVLGVAAAIQSATVPGVTGLALAGIGGYLIVLGTWQLSGRLLFALLSLTLVGAVLALATHVARKWLFGTQTQPGLVSAHIYWLGTQWWHPLLVVGAIALAVTVVAAAAPSRKRHGAMRGRRPRRR
jgi:patatin-related protein